jgi:hypothetical protein
MSISINEVLYRLTNEYHQTIEDRLCYIIVLIDSSNDNTCNHKSIIYLVTGKSSLGVKFQITTLRGTKIRDDPGRRGIK